MTTNLADEGRVRIGALAGIPAVLKDFGVDSGDVLRSVGQSVDALDDPEGVLTYVTATRLLEASVARTGCQHFGLLVGQLANLDSLGAVGRLVASAPDVRTAIIDLVNAHHINARGAISYLVTFRDTAVFGYGVHQQGAVAVDQVADLVVALSCNILRELADVQPSEILLPRSPPKDLSAYRRRLPGPIRFDAEQSAIVFPLEVLARANKGADAGIHAEMKRHLSERWAETEPDVSLRLLRLLWPRVLMLSPRVKEMADRLAMHPRTLNRRLHMEGTSFRRILNDARREIACQLLANTNLGVTQIALALGYEDPNVFTHAFSRWSGMPPSDWRGLHQNCSLRGTAPPTAPTEASVH